MTAPATPQTSPDVESLDGLGALEATIQSTIRDSQSLIGDEQAVTNRPRNEKGQFVSPSGEDPANEPKGAGEWNIIPDGETAPAGTTTETVPTDAEGAEAQGTEQAPDAPVIPEGHVALPALDPAKVQGFKVMDLEGGEIVVPDLRFEVNFRSKTGESQPRTLDVPQLVNYARMGVYNHEREQQFESQNQEIHRIRSAMPRIADEIKTRDAHIERLLSDPEYLARELTRYDQENTPEARAERQRQRDAQDRERFEVEKMAHETGVFLDTRLAPALDKLVTQFPTLDQEEVASKVLRYAEPLLVNGVLPPSAHMTVAAYVIHDLYPWAQQVHLDRESRRPKTEAPPKDPKAPVATKPAVDPQKQKLQVTNQRLRRQAAAPRLPAGNQPQGAPQKPTVPQSNRGAEDFIIARSVNATVGRSG